MTALPLRGRVVLVVLLVVVAYHHSLLALCRFLPTDTPLAYLGLLPLLCLGVALVQGRPRADEPRLPHRHVDGLVGVPLLAVAAFVALALPEQLSYGFWTHRLDMLGLPFFAAGLTSLLLGARVLGRVRLPLAALALAWPLPWQLGLDRVVGAASAVTVEAVSLLAPLVGAVRTPDSTLFRIGAGAEAFAVNVAPQCAGASSALGFLLVGGAAAAVSRGRPRAKALWLLTGTALVVALNVARILVVFGVGARLGQRAALDWLHPYIGLVLFSLAVPLLIAGMPRFGLVLLPRRRRLRGVPTPRPRARAAAVVAIACSFGLGASNAALARFDPFLGLGSGRAWTSAADLSTPVLGWTAARTSSIDWARPYFGGDSTWDRFAVTSQRTGEPVFLDVVNSSDLQSFSRYGLEACYRFHGYDVLSTGRVDLGGPATAESLLYVDQRDDRAWSVLSWVLPVRSPTGTRYERSAALLRTTAAAPARAAAAATLTGLARDLVARARPRPA